MEFMNWATVSSLSCFRWLYRASPKEGNGNPLQCSYLENPRDGGAWWAAVYGVAQSRTRLKQLSSSSSTRASPYSAAKNIINLILVLTTWWCPRVESSPVVGRGCLVWPVCSLGKTLLSFALLHFVLPGQICLFLQVSLDFLILHSSLQWCKGHLFWMLVLEGLVVADSLRPHGL